MGPVNATKDTARSEYSAGQLRVLMARLDVNAAELGRRLGRSRNWASGRARGDYAITPEDAIAIVRALGVGLGDLLMATPSERELTRGVAPVLKDIQIDVFDNEDRDSEITQERLQLLRLLHRQWVAADRDRLAARKGGR